MNLHKNHKNGFTFVEVLVAVVILAITLPGSMLTIQWARMRSQDLSMEMVASNLASSLVEQLKRAGYTEVVYGADLLDLAPKTSAPLVDFPDVSATTGATVLNLPAGAAGNATDASQYALGTNGSVPSCITSNTNYLRMNANQIAALNGYASATAASAAKAPLLNPQFAWGIYIEEQAGSPATLKMAVIIVKWRRGNTVRFTTLRTLIESSTRRL